MATSLPAHFTRIVNAGVVRHIEQRPNPSTAAVTGKTTSTFTIASTTSSAAYIIEDGNTCTDDTTLRQPEMVKAGDRCARVATIAAILLAVGSFLSIVVAISGDSTAGSNGGLRGGTNNNARRRRLLDDDDAAQLPQEATKDVATVAKTGMPNDNEVKAFIRGNVVTIVTATAGVASVVALACWWARSRSRAKVDDFVPPPSQVARGGSGAGSGGARGWWRDPSFVHFIFRRAGMNATASDVEMITMGGDPLEEAARSSVMAHPVRSRTLRWRRRSSSRCMASDSESQPHPQDGSSDGGGDGPPSQVSRSWVRAVASALPDHETHSASWLEEQQDFARVVDDDELEFDGLDRAESFLSLVSDSTPE